MQLYMIFAIVAGMGLGLATFALTRHLIKKRTDDMPKGLFLSKPYSWILWTIIGALGCGGAYVLTSDIVVLVEYILVYMVLVSLSVVDGSIRKIPNILLLVLIVIKIANTAINGTWSGLIGAVIAFVLGWVFFTFPARWGISIGWGDIKLAAVAGFYLGIIGLMQAVVVMGIVMAGYMVYLKATKKGDLKTQVAIGPPLSLGILVAMVLPIAVSLPF